LVTVQSLDADGDPTERVLARLRSWFGAEVDEWRHLSAQVIHHGHPDQRVPFPGKRPARLGPGRYVAGDHRATASIDGALRSGRRAAAAVLADLSG
jgi:hypothetical protein